MNKEVIYEELNTLLKEIDSIRFLTIYINKNGKVENLEEYEEVINDYLYNDLSLGMLYNNFYTKACPLVSLILPERLSEFKNCYSIDKKNTRLDESTFKISDYLYTQEIVMFDKFTHVILLLSQQRDILSSILTILDSRLYQIENAIQYHLYTDELKTAEELVKNNFIRAGGALAGVTFEGHLKTVCDSHNIVLGKKDTLGKYIQYLRQNNIIDAIEERLLQCINDIRTLCVHQKGKEPQKEEVENMIQNIKQVLVSIN